MHSDFTTKRAFHKYSTLGWQKWRSRYDGNWLVCIHSNLLGWNGKMSMLVDHEFPRQPTAICIAFISFWGSILLREHIHCGLLQVTSTVCDELTRPEQILICYLKKPKLSYLIPYFKKLKVQWPRLLSVSITPDDCKHESYPRFSILVQYDWSKMLSPNDFSIKCKDPRPTKIVSHDHGQRTRWKEQIYFPG